MYRTRKQVDCIVYVVSALFLEVHESERVDWVTGLTT